MSEQNKNHPEKSDGLKVLEFIDSVETVANAVGEKTTYMSPEIQKELGAMVLDALVEQELEQDSPDYELGELLEAGKRLNDEFEEGQYEQDSYFTKGSLWLFDPKVDKKYKVEVVFSHRNVGLIEEKSSTELTASLSAREFDKETIELHPAVEHTARYISEESGDSWDTSTVIRYPREEGESLPLTTVAASPTVSELIHLAKGIQKGVEGIDNPKDIHEHSALQPIAVETDGLFELFRE